MMAGRSVGGQRPRPGLVWLGFGVVLIVMLGHIPDAWECGRGRQGADGQWRTGLDCLNYADGAVLIKAGIDPYRFGARQLQAGRGRARQLEAGPLAPWPARLTQAERLRQAEFGYRLYLYPPLLAALLWPVAWLAYPWQGVLGLGLNILLVAGCLVECGRLARRLRRARPHGFPVRWSVVGVALLASLHAVQMTTRLGQVSFGLLWLMLRGYRLATGADRGRAVMLGGVCWAAAAVIKPWPALAALLLVGVVGLHEAAPEAARRRGLYVAGLLGGLVLWLWVVPGLVIGWRWNAELLQSWFQHIVRGPPLGWDDPASLLSAANQPLRNAVRLFYVSSHPGVAPLAPLPPDWAAAAVLLNGLLAALVALAVVQLIRHPQPGGAEVAVSLGLALALLSAPSLFLHGYVLMLPLYLTVPAWLQATGRPGRALGWALALIGIALLNGALWSGWGLMGLGHAALTAAAAGAALRPPPAWGAGALPAERGG